MQLIFFVLIISSCVICMKSTELSTRRNSFREMCPTHANDNAYDLLVAINRTNYEKFADATKNSLYEVQPSLRVCIVTRVTPEITSYAAYSYFIQSWFSSLHYGYIMLPLFPDSLSEDYEYHRKLVPVLETLNDESLACDFVFWMDADFIPLNLHVSLQYIISSSSTIETHVSCPSGSGSYIWLSRDVSTTINTGGMIFRNTQWTKKFITKWIGVKDKKNVYNEQLGFDYLFNNLQDNDALQRRLCIMDHHILNSVSPAVTQQMTTHEILHLAAEDNLYREFVFKEGVHNICAEKGDTADKGVYELHQLGLTRDKLQIIAMDIYSSLAQNHSNYLSSIIQNPLDDNEQESLYDVNQILMSATKYRMAISKLIHVTNHRNNHGMESITSLQTRRRAYELLGHVVCSQLLRQVDPFIASLFSHAEILEGKFKVDNEELLQINFRPLPQHKQEIRSLLPELLKLTAELGYEYLTNAWVFQHNGGLHKEENATLKKTEIHLRLQLHILKAIVHSTQTFVIESMINDFEMFVNNGI